LLGKPYVKVCGTTSESDIAVAVAAGVDALGFLVGLVYPSEDELTPEEASALIRGMPPFVTSVLVTHQSDARVVSGLCERIPAAALQLHGEFVLDDIPVLRSSFPGMKIIKAVHVTGPGAVDAAKAAAAYADAILLDTQTATRIGGTGEVHDWSISRAICHAVRPTPTILAGGLRPDNVVAAIREVQPFAVDVNSGVSLRRGVKSGELVSQFVANAKAEPSTGCWDYLPSPCRAPYRPVAESSWSPSVSEQARRRRDHDDYP